MSSKLKGRYYMGMQAQILIEECDITGATTGVYKNDRWQHQTTNKHYCGEDRN